MNDINKESSPYLNYHTALLPSHSSSQLNDGLPDEHLYVLRAELSQTLLGRPDAEVARVVETGQVVEGELGRRYDAYLRGNKSITN